MENVELKKTAEVIRNKIYNENIMVNEQLALECGQHKEKLLEANEQNISISDIEAVMQENKNLNWICGIDITKYINTDLNIFLSWLKKIRNMGLDTIINHTKTFDIFYVALWVNNILEAFTYEEGLEIKKAFLKRILNSIEIDNLEPKEIDGFFYAILIELKLKMEELTTQSILAKKMN